MDSRTELEELLDRLGPGKRGGLQRRGRSWIAGNWERVVEQLRQDGVDVLDRSTGEAITPACTRNINLHVKTREGRREGVSLIATMNSVGHKRLTTTARYCPADEAEIEQANMIVENFIVTPQDTIAEVVAVSMPDVRAKTIGERIKTLRDRKGLSRAQAAARASEVIAEMMAEGREVGRALQGGMTADLWAGWEKRCGATDKIEIAARTLETTFAALAEGRP